ncbi:MAG: macro domain-containing protein [Clostridia bacterium]|nr:macro domain-containing protein [Clostridia bacterium]
MPLLFVRNDITKMKCDAIVNAVDNDMKPDGGADAAIHKAAGPQLFEECMRLGGCATGMAKITKGFGLPAKHVIHTAGPKWQGGHAGEADALLSCYRESLKLAKENGCQSIAFPLISSGRFGYPKEQALKTAEEAIRAFLSEHEMTVYIVFYDKESFAIGKSLKYDIKEYIEECRVRAGYEKRRRVKKPRFPIAGAAKPADAVFGSLEAEMPVMADKSLIDELDTIDESFSQMLLRKITEKGMSDPECYQRANIDRKLFSKIRNDVNYRPKKTTVIAFAVALELSLDETKEMLMKAGFALSHSNKFDIIIEYFISRGRYDLFEINEALFEFDQVLLGA